MVLARSIDCRIRSIPETLDVFTFDFISGDKTNCFSTPNSVLLSTSLAEKYFSSTDVIGKLIIIGDDQFTVKGVFANWPKNSHLDVKALFYSGVATSQYEPQDWFDLEYYNYVLLNPSKNQEYLNERLEQLKTERLKPILEESGIDVKLHGQSLNSLYFESALIDDVPKGNLLYINALAFSGVLLLLIAGLNYINLSLTQSSKRIKEISIKKILGISRKQHLFQNGTESLIMTLMVLVVAMVLVFLFDDLYFHSKDFRATNVVDNWALLVIIFVVIFAFGILGSGYVGVHLSISGALTNKSETTVGPIKMLLLGIQFVIASVIIIATLTMNRQINFMKNKDLGFSKEQVVILNLPGDEELMSKWIHLREQYKNHAIIENASLVGGGALPGEENGKEIFEVTVDGGKTDKIFNIYRIDENYCDLLNIKFAFGRNFQSSRISDRNDAVIINESLAKSLNWENPLSKVIWYAGQPRNVIGVVRNFHNKSLHNVIGPIVFIYDENYSSNLLVKTQASNVGIIKSMWDSYFPAIPFEITYFDQFIDMKYAKEDGLTQLLGFFSIISLALCCMGLFAIFGLHMVQKTKEMSIRKVLGANSIGLIKVIIKNYLLLALLAISIAIPVAWIFMNHWLTGFSYKIQMDPLIYIFSAVFILLMCCITITYHVIKVIHVNPVDYLKSE